MSNFTVIFIYQIRTKNFAYNFFKAHVKAAVKLLPSENQIAAGKPYHISDGTPYEPYVFLKPLFDAMDQPLPFITIPYFLVHFMAWLSEMVHIKARDYFWFEPIVTRNEACKVCTSHWCNIEKAKTELGYVPVDGKVSFYKKKYICSLYQRVYM